MRVIGLTGGIGSGKSFVADVAQRHFKVVYINTDELARRQMQKGGVSFEKVKESFKEFSQRLIGPDGEIDRKELSRIVLADPELVKKLDGITHPPVIEEIERTIDDEKKKNDNEALIVETALIYESGIDRICDEVWYVYAPLATRRDRLMSERGYDSEKIDLFLANQKPEEEFLNRADRTVPNGADVSEEDMVRIISGYLNRMEN